MTFTVYILFSHKDKKLYIGQTSNLLRRIKAHSEGRVKSTKHRRPLDLIYREDYDTRSEAMKREFELKSDAEKKFKRILRINSGAPEY